MCKSIKKKKNGYTDQRGRRGDPWGWGSLCLDWLKKFGEARDGAEGLQLVSPPTLYHVGDVPSWIPQADDVLNEILMRDEVMLRV